MLPAGSEIEIQASNAILMKIAINGRENPQCPPTFYPLNLRPGKHETRGHQPQLPLVWCGVS